MARQHREAGPELGVLLLKNSTNSAFVLSFLDNTAPLFITTVTISSGCTPLNVMSKYIQKSQQQVVTLFQRSEEQLPPRE